jgi:hypothetical protein
MLSRSASAGYSGVITRKLQVDFLFKSGRAIAADKPVLVNLIELR